MNSGCNCLCLGKFFVGFCWNGGEGWREGERAMLAAWESEGDGDEGLRCGCMMCARAGYMHGIMETKGGRKSKESSIQYESPLGYVIEDVRPHGGSEKFRTAAYSDVIHALSFRGLLPCLLLPPHVVGRKAVVTSHPD